LKKQSENENPIMLNEIFIDKTTNKQWHLKTENQAIQMGRPIEAIDKDKRRIREIIDTVLDDNTDRFQEELDKLKGPKFVDFYIKLLEYVVPKLQRQAIEIAQSQGRRY